MKSLFIVLVILMLGTVACTSNDDAVNALQQEVDAMKQEIKTLEADNALQQEVDALRAELKSAPDLEECLTVLFSTSEAPTSDIPLNDFVGLTSPWALPYNYGGYLVAMDDYGGSRDWVTDQLHSHSIFIGDDGLPPECM